MDPPQPQDVVEQQQQQLQQPLGPDPNAPIVNAAGENLQCQWRGCGERCTSPEALYEHVCERHVGRKSTNNLNLTCAWGQCNTTTVKRDHITSHIRVHVPLKPHKCEFCGKAFKRPQDLKKHVKTHADDSVIMRSPEPNGGQRGQTQGMVYDKAPQGYYQPAMPPQDYSGQHPTNQYYQPQQHPQMQAGQHPGYGPVSYYPAPTQASYGDFESRKRGFDALDQFFGQVKRREFDPVNYQNVSRRLFELQGLQLPIIAQQPISAIPAYQPVAAMGGGYDQADPIQAYSLPPMGNAKTREDLTSIDHILEQMQATIYENDTHLAQAGVAQPGASYVAYRTSNSPPSAHLPSTHAHSSMLQHQHHGSIASASDSGATPGLTPPSSAHSPMVGNSAPGSGGMYPTLPANASDMAYTAANAATLSNQWENEELRRRYGGGMLQRAQPARKNSADMDRDGSATPPAAVLNKQAKGKKKPSPKNSVIDPALSGDAGTPGSSKSGGEIAKSEEDRERDWVQNMRLIEWMRDFIKKKIEAGQYEGGEREPKAELDTNMGGTEDEHKKDQEQLYPVLQAVEAES